MTSKYRVVLRFRPFRFFFNKNWYSTVRWGNPGCFDRETLYLIDVGAITFGYVQEFNSKD